MDKSVVFLEREGSVGTANQLGSKYFLGEQLGRGAMGVVYDATTTDGASLAVKLLRPELATDEKTVARFVQERQIFRRIDHPNVVRVDDLVAEGDQLGIAMEKVCGGDLRQRVEGRSLTPRISMAIAADVAAGLDAIHAAGVVHRDLKPANILIAETADGLQPKISDFGISLLVSETMTRTSTTIGTPLYMAPEAADRRGAGAPSDIYSLGAMMFELLIGTAPFHEGGTFAVLLAHAQDAPPFIGGVPTELADLIDRMLAKEPAVRPTAAQVRQQLLDIIPSIDDDVHTPIAIDRTGAGGGAAAGTAGVGAAAAGSAAAAAAGFATVAVATAAVEAPVDDAGNAAVSNPFANQAPGRTTPDRGSGAAADPGAPVTGDSAFGPGGGRKRPMFLNRLPRRSAEIGMALASLAAVIAVFAWVTTRADAYNTSTAIGSEGSPVADGRFGSNNSGFESVGGSGNGTPGGPGIFDPNRSDGSIGTTADSAGSSGSDGRTTSTTARRTTSTTKASTSTTGGSTTTTEAPTTTAPSTVPSTVPSTAPSTVPTPAPSTAPTTAPSTSTTRPTTTTTQPTTTTTEATTTTAPSSTPIKIVSGPTVNQVGPTSFQFNYSTNDVCGTGTFTVVDKVTGTVKGSFTGQNICYGPLHGGFPQDSHPVFGGYNLQPGTTYRVLISVRGTPSDGYRAAGSGTASTSFEVTTTS